MYNRFKAFALNNYNLVNILNICLAIISAIGYSITHYSVILSFIALAFAFWMIVITLEEENNK